jgi:hypothetical protein
MKRHPAIGRAISAAHIARFNATFDARFWARVKSRTPNECWLWVGTIVKNGYGVARHNQVDKYVHRIVWEITFGPIPSGMFVCHHCDVKTCVNPGHLFLGTSAENTRDAMRKGLMPKGARNWMYGKCGEKHPNSKLTNTEVLAIRKQCADGANYSEVARRFGLSDTAVGCIVKRQIWKHI